MSQNFEDGSDYETEFKCSYCGEDRFNTAFGCSVHSTYYCQQNPNRAPVPNPRTEIWDGPQYMYPVEEDLVRQRERHPQNSSITVRIKVEKQEKEQEKQPHNAKK